MEPIMKHRNSDSSGRHRKGWQFSYFSESNEESTDELPETEQNADYYPLAEVKLGKRVWVAGFQGKGGINRLLGMGLTIGVELKVISSQPSGSVLVAIQDNRIGVGAGIAHKILVSDQPLNNQKENTMVNTEQIFLREMKEGTKGRIIGYNQVGRGYKGKLLSMGLTPNTEFEIIRVAPLGDPVEILVRGFHLSLRKQESDALVVELV
jgi:ferrous iron transport protein A